MPPPPPSLLHDLDLIEPFLKVSWQFLLCEPVENEIKYAWLCSYFFFLMPSTNEGKKMVIDDSTKRKVRSLHSSGFFFFLFPPRHLYYDDNEGGGKIEAGFTGALQTARAHMTPDKRVCRVCRRVCFKSGLSW